MLDPAAHGLLPPDARPEIPGGGPQSVAEVLGPGLRRDPERIALVGRRGRFRYRELDAESDRAAQALLAAGVGPGDRVAACLPNDVDLVIAFLGAMRVGAIWVGVNRPLAPPEKVYVLRDAGARLLLATPEVERELAPLRGELSDLAAVLPVDPEAPDAGWLGRVAEAAPEPVGLPIDPFAPAAIAYTSGTTGRPKGAVHSQHNILLPGAVSAASGLHPPDRAQGVVLPLTILNLVVLGPMAAFQVPTTCVAMDRIDPLGIAEWVRRERIHTFHGVPTLFHDLLTHPEVSRDDLAPLGAPMVGGAECPEAFRALYRERFGGEVSIGYGMTEAPTAVTTARGEPSPEPGLCGAALPQVEIRILDDQGAALAPDAEGEICVAPASVGAWAGVYTPMLGYWGRPEATAEALRGGVYHTGDVGLLRADGRLFIRGRRGELILRGGANVYPAEVERVLQELPGVAEAAVFGLPDERLGERVVAVVVRRAGAPASEVSEASLRQACAAELARYKVPDRIVFATRPLPRNAMSKVVKRELRSLFE